MQELGKIEGRATKELVYRWIFARMFEMGQEREELRREIKLFLADGVDTELKIEALGNAAKDSFAARRSEPLSADGELEWIRLAQELGLPTDLERTARIKSRGTRWIGRIAAVLIPAAVIVGGALFFKLDKNNMDATSEVATVVQTPSIVESSADSVRTITLEDGSRVTLNRRSTLTYNGSRQMELHGEAFFEVVRDEEHPFIVRAEQITVVVLGTEFSINTNEDGRSSVRLYSGVVEIDRGGEIERLDAAGDKFSLDNATHKAQMEQFDTSSLPAWVIEGERGFNIMPLSAIFDQLEAVYGVQVMGRDRISTDHRMNFVLHSHMPLEDVLDALEFSSGDFSYTIEGDKVSLRPHGHHDGEQ